MQIGLPDILALAAEFQEVGPGKKAGAVAVIEDDAHGIGADGLQSLDLYLALAPDQLLLAGSVALDLRTRAFDPQILRGKLEPSRMG